MTAFTIPTITTTIDRDNPEPHVLALAGDVIRQGGLVAFPTETVYGLGANALDEAAVARIFAAKERPANDPVIVHIHTLQQLEQVASDIPEVAYLLAERFWAGALTLVLKKSAAIPLNVTAGRDTVAVRMPAHPIALALLEEAGVPIGAPSANRFARPSPTSAQHVRHDLEGRVDVILDAGSTDIGVESTIVDVTSPVPTVLRPGGISLEALREVVPTLAFRPQYLAETVASAPAPGSLLKHYSPNAELRLYDGADDAAVFERMRADAAMLHEAGKKVGILALDGDALNFEQTPAQIVLAGRDVTAFAASLFAGVRALDAVDVEVILVRAPADTGLGLAVRDRLLRAAEGKVIEV
jgi:L-threonylcarbamoyladenylate synthase